MWLLGIGPVNMHCMFNELHNVTYLYTSVLFKTFCVMLCSFCFRRSIFWSLFWPAWTRGHSDAPMRACRGHEFQKGAAFTLAGNQWAKAGWRSCYSICVENMPNNSGEEVWVTAAEPAQNGRGTCARKGYLYRLTACVLRPVPAVWGRPRHLDRGLFKKAEKSPIFSHH